MAARVLPVIVAVLLLVPANVRAVTVDDIVALSNAGVTDSILIAVIDADQTVFDLTPQQVLELKQAGVSDTVVVKMVGTAREFEGRPMRREPPSLVIIGEKPPSPEPPPAPTFTVVTPIFFPAVPVQRATAPDHHARPPQEHPPEHGRDRARRNDGQIDSFGHRGVCVRGGWVGWCGSE